MDNQEFVQKEIIKEKGTSDGPVIKVQLPKEAATRVQMALSVLKERKADTKVDELLSEFLNGITEEYLDAQIEKRTPEDYYFEAAKNIPELREKIIQQAKKALQKSDKQNLSGLAVEIKKTKKKLKDEAENTAPDESPVISENLA